MARACHSWNAYDGSRDAYLTNLFDQRKQRLEARLVSERLQKETYRQAGADEYCRVPARRLSTACVIHEESGEDNGKDKPPPVRHEKETCHRRQFGAQTGEQLLESAGMRIGSDYNVDLPDDRNAEDSDRLQPYFREAWR